jgi:hypothetical protein
MPMVLWIASGVLAAMMLVAGLTKALKTTQQLHETGLTYVEDFPGWFIRALGMAEVLAAIGLVLPGVVEIAPVLVPIAAICVGLTMVGAMLVHVRRGEHRQVGMPVGLLLLAVFVVWGRLGAWPL